MGRETIILSDLDIKILQFVESEKTVTQILDKFEIGFSQCKRHLNRIEKYVSKRKYGTFVYVKLNLNGEKILELI